MRVVANSLGYFGSLRNAGDEFEVPDGTKGSWFAPVESEVKAKSAKSKGKGESPAPEQPVDEAADAI
jgi:hypothetical protein